MTAHLPRLLLLTLATVACNGPDPEPAQAPHTTAQAADGPACPAPPPKEVTCDTTPVEMTTSLGVWSPEHHAGKTEDVSRFVNDPDKVEPCTPTNSIFEPDKLRDQCKNNFGHGVQGWYKWKAWCVKNPNAANGDEMVVQTPQGQKVIKTPKCLAKAERLASPITKTYEWKDRISPEHKHSGYWYKSSCSFEETRANPIKRAFCQVKGSFDLKVWPGDAEGSQNHYGDSVILGIAYAAEHSDHDPDGVNVGFVLGYGSAGVLITPNEGGGRDWTYHGSWVVDLECVPSAKDPNKLIPRRKAARVGPSASASEVIHENSGER